MKAGFAVAVLSVLAGTSAFAEQIAFEKLKCIADHNGHDRIDVPVQLSRGGDPTQKIPYDGHQLAAAFSPGDRYESQQILVIDIDRYITRIYDPKLSLYTVSAPDGVRVQCYIER